VGTVTVAVRVAGGTATPGKDFANAPAGGEWRDVLVTFKDGQSLGYVDVWIASDKKRENLAQPETFTLELVSPTGGAALGLSTKESVAITEVTGGSSGGSGGGGALGSLATLLLGLGGGLRRLLADDLTRRPRA